MPTFALPLASSTRTTHAQSHSSRVRFSNLPTRKRKRPVPTSPENSSPEVSQDEDDSENIGLLPASTNPLSLTPAEIAQYRLAGLRLDEEIPSVKSFPHRGLPKRYDLKLDSGSKPLKDRKGKGKAVEEDTDHNVEIQKSEEEDPRQGVSRGSQLRVRHLGVLTTMLQRCLMEGDIERAKRAWAMLIRGQFGGKPVDLRQSGYWGIGAELLMRSMVKPSSRPSYDSDSEEEDQAERNGTRDGWRWGSKEGLEKMKDYYERLILQHPYKRHFHGSVNALDFWPAMIGCEIYGIQAEQKDSSWKLEKEEENDDGGERSDSQSDGSEEDEDLFDPTDSGFAADQRRKDRRLKRRAYRRWAQREEIRQTALAAAERIAARLDDLMETPPFSDSQNLLRLRGMLGLYIGDLSVPDQPIDDEGDEAEDKSSLRSQRLSQGGNTARYSFRQRMNDHERGKKRQAEEQANAQRLFSRI
ncbi:uncharacterized protein LY89DRAFT_551569, partial [Mollisia scopiformis]